MCATTQPPRNDPPGGIMPIKVITPSMTNIQKNNHGNDIPCLLRLEIDLVLAILTSPYWVGLILHHNPS